MSAAQWRPALQNLMVDMEEKKIRRHLARACQRRGFGWKRWSREWMYGTPDSSRSTESPLWAAHLGSRSGLIGLINFDVKCAGARSAGNPHATCDVAGAGNQLTARIVRHSERKRGATDRPDLRSNGASPRPYQVLLFPSATCHLRWRRPSLQRRSCSPRLRSFPRSG